MKSKRLMDTISLNCLIQAYIQLKEIQKAIQTVREMKESGIHPDSATYTILLTACADSKLFEEGRTIHRLAARNLNGNSIELMTSIINFYTKCGRPEIAIKECERLKSKGLMNNTSMWNCLIQAYIQNNEIQKGIQIIHEMKDSGFNPDSISFTILLTACADLKLFEEGKMIHQLVTASKEKESVELFTATHNFYTKCGHPELAFR